MPTSGHLLAKRAKKHVAARHGRRLRARRSERLSMAMTLTYCVVKRSWPECRPILRPEEH